MTLDNSIEILCHIFERENATIIIDPTSKEITIRKLGTFTRDHISNLRNNGFIINHISPKSEHLIDIVVKRIDEK